MAELQTYFYDFRFKSLLRKHMILILGPDAVGFLKQTANINFHARLANLHLQFSSLDASCMA
uniref:Uncharacterized protein n=1 Tax=Aegilops tauschii subsp. strangulata TaxID=200361 RepID=A0A452YLD3_AEGTS